MKVLDKGYVKLVDYMGNDDKIVSAARRCYGKEDTEEKTTKQKRVLINHLLASYPEHKRPFEFVEFEFSMKLPMFVRDHLIRYRAASPIVQSGRYSQFEEYYVPERFQYQEESKELLKEACDESLKTYSSLKKRGERKELSRLVLPHNIYTTWNFKIDLWNFFNLCHQRLQDAAQEETRLYAEAMYIMVKEIVPMACQAFEDNILNAMKLTKPKIVDWKNKLEKGDYIFVLKELWKYGALEE